MRNTEVAVVGGGIAGLAFALAHAKRGRKVTLFERSEFAVGASVRNFGLLWPVGQPLGPLHDRAMRSREIWLDVIQSAGLWHSPSGSLHLAYAEDEWAVLTEYASLPGVESYGRRLLNAAEARAKSAVARPQGLIGALWSPTEVNVDPREAIRKIPAMLRDCHGVELSFGTHVSSIELPRVSTSKGEWSADEVVICSGHDFETLFPETFASSGLTRCKLQMLRSVPQEHGWKLGPSLCAGLTLTHYDAFTSCRNVGPLKERLARELPFHVQNGVHVLLSQTARGELTIGDSHHYGLTVEPFDQEAVNESILSYLEGFAHAVNLQIAERWHGVYSKLPGQTEFIARPADGVLIATGMGAGMTLAFGLAEELVNAG